MIKNKKRFLFGVIFAPIFILFAQPLFNCLIPIFKRELSCVEGIASFAFIGLPVFLVAFIIYLPLIYLFIKKRWTGIIHFGLGGVLVSLILSLAMILSSKGANVFGTLLIMIIMGIVSALLLWVIAIRNNLKEIHEEM